MEKAFWGIMGALTITFLGLLGVYLYKSGAFSRPEEVVVVEEPHEIKENLDSFLQPSQEKYGDAMKALEDDREPIRLEESADIIKNKDDNKSDSNVSYVEPSGEIATNRNDGYDNFLEEKEEPKEEQKEENKKDDEKGKNVKTEEWEYTVFKDYVKVTKYLGSAISLDIPDKFEGKPVTELGDSVFAKNIKLVNVTFPDCVTKLGLGIFKECTALVDVELPSKLNQMGKETFMSCPNLVRMTLPNGVKKIPNSTFEGCISLSKISLPKDITDIGTNCFKGCIALPDIELGNSLTNLGESAFSGCILISEITIPKTLDVIGASCFDGCSGLIEISFPKKSVLSVIGDMAFQNCSLIEEVILPSKVTAIGEKAFTGCSALADIYIPKSVISIKADAFTGCPFKEVTISKSCVVNNTAFPSGIEIYYY